MAVRDKDVFDYEYEEDTGTVRVNTLGSIYGASIEDYPEVMSRVINILQEVPNASSVILSESRDYEYGEEQVSLLRGVADAIQEISSQGYLSQNIKTEKCDQLYSQELPEVQQIVFDKMRRDPVGAYVELKRKKRHLKQEMENSEYPQQSRCRKYFIQDVVSPVLDRIEECEIIDRASDYITGHHVGDREVYREFFHPLVRPNFMLTKFMSLPPERGEEVDRYSVRNDIDVTLYDVPDQTRPVYHVDPPEFNLPEEKYNLLDAARRYMASHDPESGEFARPERMKDVFENIGRDMLRDIANQMDMQLGQEELQSLTDILNRYTSGLGVLELLLADPKIEDVYINSPIGDSPIFISHQEYGECETNLIPTKDEAESWATRFRIQSGRPLDEANPVLDTETEVTGGRARVAVIQENLSPEGLAFAFRRHRSRAWTLPLFIQNNMINPLGAGLLSFIIDGNRSVIFSGTRGAGKCVSGDTEIQLSNGNIVKIEDMVGGFKEEIEDGTLHDNRAAGEAIALSNQKKLSEEEITDVWKRESPEELIKIETESGREIRTTPEHPYFTYSDGLKKLRADNLEEGNYIATPRSFETSSEKQEIDIDRERFEFEETDEGFIVYGETNAQEVKFPREVDEDLAEFLGLVLGDGHVNEKKIEFHNSVQEIQDRFESLVSRFGVSCRGFESHSTTVSQVTSRNLSRILKDVFSVPFGKKSGKIEIPDKILKSPDKVVRGFIRGYFAADGFVSENKREIELSTKSEKMKKQLRMVLLRFGITAYTKKKDLDSGEHYRVFIRGKFADRFAEKIGIAHNEKQERLEEMLEKDAINNTNTDVVPGAGKEIKELREALRMSPKQFRECGKDYWAYENEEYNVGRNWLEKITNHFEDRWDKLQEMEEQAELLEEFAEKDYEEMMGDLDEVRDILDISYNALAADIGFTESGMRNTVQNRKRSREMIEGFDKIVQTLNSRIKKFEKKTGSNLEELDKMVEAGIVTYREVSDRTEIPLTSVKNYSYGEIDPSEDRRQKIETEIENIKKETHKNLKKARKKIDDFKSASTELAQIMAALKEFREVLNIEREEYEGVHDQTVSQVLSSETEPSIEVMQKLAASTADIYREATDRKTEKLLEELSERADSDLYWDKIKKIEAEVPEEEHVFDLTVGNKHNFIANGLIAHNTSLLSASMLEIMKNHRIVSVEDSVTGDSSIIYRKDSEVRYGEIGDLIDTQIEEKGSEDRGGRDVLPENPDNVKVLSMDDSGNMRWSDASLFMRHDVEKPIYEIETRTGRKLKVTEDHSVFGMSDEGSITEVRPTELDEGDHLVTPRKLDIPSGEKEWNLSSKASELDGYFKNDLDLRDYRSELRDFADENDYSEHTAQYWVRENIVPAEAVEVLDIETGKDTVYKHKRTSSELPVEIELDKRFMEFLGLWMADGCYDNRSVLVTVSDERCQEVVREVFERFGLPVKLHSDEHSLMANSQPLKEVMQKHGFTGDAYSKRIPEWIFSASEEQRHAFLRGFYSSDGYSTSHEAGIDLINEELIEDIQTLLLIDGIRGRARDSGKMRSMRISDLEGLRKFKEKIGFLQDYKNDNLDLEDRESTHDTTDVVPLPRDMLEELCSETEMERHDYVTRGNELGRQKLKQVIGRSETAEKISQFADSDIFWDQVKSIEKVSEEETVYDISVPGDENFITSNILAHNTLELPVPQMKDLGYNIERMKSRSVITQVENELGADEAIRTSLRLGDSALVIGEVRSEEAQALYEAMRVGAVANFVGGTIHGEDAYSVFDRVVNDLNVPKTSFKATDIIVSVNKIKSPDGLETYRRVTGITEVRKEWTDDPQEENAFVDLMRYDSNEDELVPTDTLINGESLILNRIAENIREWKNNWDAVWNNIQLRKDIKQELVEKAEETGDDDLLEAEFVVKANQQFHLISEKVHDEYGRQEPERILNRWKEWLDQQV
ncbi:MAG: LAGLIDADG family homing endonuclease [Candidatus Nanohalobium sp.]